MNTLKKLLRDPKVKADIFVAVFWVLVFAWITWMSWPCYSLCKAGGMDSNGRIFPTQACRCIVKVEVP